MLQYEDVAEFTHRPDLCKQAYRMIALRKKISVEKGQEKLFDEYRYFFYITNDRTSSAEEIVFLANDRCDQENLIAQLKDTGTGSMRNPLDNLYSNWAYMVISSLAWTLKAWCGLLLPAAPGSHHQTHNRPALLFVSHHPAIMGATDLARAPMDVGQVAGQRRSRSNSPKKDAWCIILICAGKKPGIYAVRRAKRLSDAMALSGRRLALLLQRFVPAFAEPL